MTLQRQRRRLSGSVHEAETFQSMDLRNSIAVSSVFKDCTFKDCKFNGATLDNATFDNCIFLRCSMQMCRLISRLYGCTFADCDLDQSAFNGADIRGTVFRACRLEYAIFDRATVIDGKFLNCQLHGARLDFAETQNVDFTGSNLWGAVIPISCATFVGNRFDRRQIGLFLAILTKTLDYDERLPGVVDPLYMKMMDRLVAREEVT
jgi:fluoroquinolone resistance protein